MKYNYATGFTIDKEVEFSAAGTILNLYGISSQGAVFELKKGNIYICKKK